MSLSPIVEQAGAVMYRRDESGEIQILTVRSKTDPTIRIFPKGHIDEGEDEVTTAARECLEEAGMSGTVTGYGADREFTYKKKRYHVKYYVMSYTSKENEGEPGREPQWNTIPQTRELLPYQDLKDVLDSSIKLM